MFLKSYDGWVAVGDREDRAFLAKFTKADGEDVHYGFAALRRLKGSPPENYTKADSKLIAQAVTEGPGMLRGFKGWSNYGGTGKRRKLMAHFVKASGASAHYNPASLDRLSTNPPKEFTPFDRVVIETAFADCPVPRR